MAVNPNRWTYNYSSVSITGISKFEEASRKNVATISDNNSNPEYKTIEGDSSYYLVGPYNITFTGSIESVIVKSDGKEISHTITDKNGTEKSIKSGSSFYIKINKKYTSIDSVDVKVQKEGTITFKASYSYTENWTTSDSSKAQIQGLDGKRTNDEISVKLDTYNEISLPGASFESGTLVILKVDSDTGTVLPGAKFKITDKSGNTIKTDTTNSEGKITITGLEPGTYYIEETKAPEGYEKSNTKKKVTVNKNATETFTFKNSKPTTSTGINLKKVDSRDTSIPLEGVGFTFTTSVQVLESTDNIKTKTRQVPGYWVATIDGHKAYGISNHPTSEFIEVDPNTEQGTEKWAHFVNHQAYKTEVDKYVEYAYKTKTAYLTKNGNWTFSKTIIYTDTNGRIKISTINQPSSTELPAMSYYTDKDGKNGKYTDEAITLPSYYVQTDGDQPIITAQEVSNSHYGYTERPSTKMNLNKETVVKNKQIYVKLSGIVWLDNPSGKNSLGDNRYDSSTESGIEGITVRLKNLSGNIEKETTTGKDGKYLFENVNLDNLIAGKYYIEFEYHGIKYQAVDCNIGEYNTSKAEEDTSRQDLNDNFKLVEGNGTQNLNVNNKVSVNYTSISNYKSSFESASGDEVKANTYLSKYRLEDNWNETQSEIKNINLGLYERPKIDLALGQDLVKVTVSSNGQAHIYNYNSRNYTKETNNNYKNSNVSYVRTIYESDAEYGKSNQNKFAVDLTYKITLINQSGNSYVAKINNLVNYYNKQYEIIEIGTNLDDYNKLSNTNGMSFETLNYNNTTYNKAKINTNVELENGETKEFYIKYRINGENTVELLKDGGKELYPVTEINSYTTYLNGSIVAAIDIDSVPGNAKPGDVSTYEDDTEAAPKITLKKHEPSRVLTGTVFLDSTTGELKTGEIRQGNGAYDSGEKLLEGINVRLQDMDDANHYYDATTNSSGEYKFEGFVPGRYQVIFTWGDNEYKVQYYKGTVYDSNRNQEDEFWYKNQDRNLRISDAIDNYNTRLQIDGETASVTDSTLETRISNAYAGNSDDIIKTLRMDSATPTMYFGVEYGDTNFSVTDGRNENSDGKVYTIPNIDFGIVERARQQMDITKRMTYFKITLANGQVLAEANIDENGNVTGELNYVTYMGPTINNGYENNGFIKAEVDKEIIENANLLIRYEIIVTNNSEKDYYTKEFYKYGTVPTEDKVITLRPSTIIEYLDSDMILNPDENYNLWDLTNINDIKKVNAYYSNDSTFLAERTLYANTNMGAMAPASSKTLTLTSSKLLTSTDEYSFYNDVEVATINKPSTDQHIGSVAKFSINGVVIDAAENAYIIPPTGENEIYKQVIIISVISLAILSTGVVLIKKFVIG